jgi:hypothetical protein
MLFLADHFQGQVGTNLVDSELEQAERCESGLGNMAIFGGCLVGWR